MESLIKFKQIKSAENNTFKRILSLNTKKGREKANAYIIEGERFTTEALASEDVELIALSETYASRDMLVPNRFPEDKTVVLADYLFEKASNTETAQGVLAVCSKRGRVLGDVLSNNVKNQMYIIAEDINDPGNLGTIIRTAGAAGADAVILTENCAELHNPKVVRAAAGAVIHVPVVEGQVLTEAVSELRGLGVKIYAAHLSGVITPYDLNLKESCAFIVGNEARGLSETSVKLADALVKLPMPGRAESLNAAMAAGILIYEVVRQRNKG